MSVNDPSCENLRTNFDFNPLTYRCWAISVLMRDLPTPVGPLKLSTRAFGGEGSVMWQRI